MSRDDSVPFKEVRHLIRDLNRSEKEAAARGFKEGNRMLENVFVHLIKGEDRAAAAARKKKRVWTAGDGGDFSDGLPPMVRAPVD